MPGLLIYCSAIIIIFRKVIHIIKHPLCIFINMSRHLLTCVIIATFSVSIISCNNNKSDRSVTKQDQKTFVDYFKFEPTADVKNFNYFPDEMGIDTSYWVSFECNESTFDRIRERLELQQEKKPQDGLIGGLNIEPTAWWDTAFIKKEIPYSRQKENQYWYLWYDKNKKTVYFLTFDT